jgi:filamentous hemagglutinin family protein
MVSASSIRFQLLLSTAVAASLALPSGAAAQNLPVNPSAGSVSTSGDGKTMTVGLTAPRTAINWQSFDVGQGYAVDFDGPNTVQAVLNRVVGDPSTGIISQSDINGILTSDPWIEVFLINPSGIVFGNGASVDVGSLVASTLNISDADFLAGTGDVDGMYNFLGTNSDPNAVVSTGVTVTNSARVNTTSGRLILIGASVDVQAGATVSGTGDVGLAAGNWVRFPADAGSPISFQIRRPTSVSGGITVGGDVSGSNVVAFMETSDNADDALLLVSGSGSITATKDGDGFIVLGMGARTEADTFVNSPGGIRNDGELTAPGNIVLSGALASDVEYRPRFVENNGTIDAGGDVVMKAHELVSNVGDITAGDDVFLSAIASGSETGTIPDVQVVNSGTITAGDDVHLVASATVVGPTSATGTIILLAAAAPALASSPDVQVTNSGTINAGGDVTLSGTINVSDFSTDTIAFTPQVQVLNDGSITAAGNVTLSGAIEAFDLAGSHVTVTAGVNVSNDGPITAGGDVNLGGTISLYNIGGTDSAADVINLAANFAITNSGKITAGGDVNIDGDIELFNLEGLDIAATGSMQLVNSATIVAGGDVNVDGTVLLFNVAESSSGFFADAASSISASAALDITNSGNITAGGDIDVGGDIELFNLAGSEIEANATMNVANSGTMSAGGDVDIAGNIDLFNIAGSTSSFSPAFAGTITANANLQITNLGTISAGGDVSIRAAVDESEIFATAINSSIDVGIANDGMITAGGDVTLRAAYSFTDVSASSFAFTSTAHVTNGGTISAQGDVHIFANDIVTNSGKIVADNVFISGASSGYESGSGTIGDIINSGTIDARGDVHLIAENNITNSGIIDAGGAALLDAINIDNSGSVAAGGDAILTASNIDNSGSVAAGGDAILIAYNDILDSSGSLAGSVSGLDVVLIAEDGSITAGTVTARDDIAIRAFGTVTTGSLTSGATIGGNGPVDSLGAADEFLQGVDLTGHDVDVDGGAIFAGVIRALGAGSDIRLRKPVTATVDDLDFAAGGDITIDGAATGVDVAMDAGGDIATGDISARDDIALRAGGTLDVGILASGVTVGGQGPVDQAGSADALLGQTLTGHDLFVQASEVNLPQVTANGTNSDLTVIATSGGLNVDNGTAGGTITLTKNGATGILTADTLSAGTGVTLRSSTDIEAGTVQTTLGDLDFAAGGDVTVDNPLQATDVAIDAGGTITTGNISARDDIALRAGGTLDVGLLTSGVTVGGVGPLDSTGAADAMLGTTLTGHDLFVQAAEVNLPTVTANGTDSDLTVIATTGGLNIDNGTAGGAITLTKEGTTGVLTAGTLSAGTGVKLRSSTDIDAGTVTTTAGDLDFGAAGDVTVDSSLAATDVAIDAGGDINTGDISARDDIALRAGGTLDVGLLTSGVTVGGTGPLDSAGAADTLLGQTLTGHDLFVQASEVNLPTVTANGTDSDLTVIASAGGLTIGNGTAGGAITLTKHGADGILSAGALSAGTGVKLRSSTDIAVNAVQTASGDLDFGADGDVTAGGALSGTDVANAAAGTITTGNISARDDIALRAGDTLHTGTLASGVAIGGQGPVDSTGAADALLGDTLAGHDISVRGGHVDLASATANGSGSDLVVRATAGDLDVANGKADGTITLVKEGSSGTLTAGTLAAGTGASLTSSTGIAATNVQSAGGEVDFDAVQGVSVGTVVAQAGDVNILADDLDILGGITGAQVSITNRAGGNAVTVLGDASATGAFALTEAELNRIHADTVSIDSLGQNLLVGNVAFADDVGATRLNLLGTGRVDIVGELSASGSGRTLQIGGTTGAADPNDPSTLASIIRIAPMSSGGGRIIFAGGSLDLRGAKIGVGLDDGFLTPLGLVGGGTPASTDVVQNDWIGNFRSSLYGIPGGYADPVVISAGTITVTYADYALFQNTAGRGPGSGVNADVLQINSSGDEGNGFELFGTIDQVGGIGAAFLVQPQFVSLPNSRINGCLILTGGGCGNPPGGGTVTPDSITGNPTSDANSTDPSLTGGGAADEFSEQELVSSDDDEAFSFDSLVGTNNEGLLGVLGVDDATAPPCAPDDKRDLCQVKEKANEQ